MPTFALTYQKSYIPNEEKLKKTEDLIWNVVKQIESHSYTVIPAPHTCDRCYYSWGCPMANVDLHTYVQVWWILANSS